MNGEHSKTWDIVLANFIHLTDPDCIYCMYHAGLSAGPLLNERQKQKNNSITNDVREAKFGLVDRKLNAGQNGEDILEILRRAYAQKPQ